MDLRRFIQKKERKARPFKGTEEKGGLWVKMKKDYFVSGKEDFLTGLRKNPTFKGETFELVDGKEGYYLFFWGKSFPVLPGRKVEGSLLEKKGEYIRPRNMFEKEKRAASNKEGARDLTEKTIPPGCRKRGENLGTKKGRGDGGGGQRKPFMERRGACPRRL